MGWKRRCRGHRTRSGLLAAIAAAAVVVGLAPIAGAPPASAALVVTGGACGFHLGAPFETGATQKFALEVPVYPADPHQVCHVTVSAVASLRPAGGGSFTNVSGNPSAQTITLNFTGGPDPLGVTWLWSPHCADPAAPGIFSLTMAGQSSSMPEPADSCFPDLGGQSSLTFQGVDPSDGEVVVGISGTLDSAGYVTVSATGVVQARGDAVHSGDTPFLNRPAVGIVEDPAGPGYWVAASDGGVFAFGNAGFHGSLGNIHLNAPIVGIAPTPNGAGYWLVAADGGVFAFGNAGFHGSLGNIHLNAPIVGIAATPNGAGYWLAAYDGGVFAFGRAPFQGSAGAASLSAPVLGISGTRSGGGYWLVGGDGGVFTYGDAPFFGSTPLEP
jgi:hypothetical protein